MKVKISSLVKLYTILLLSEESKHGYDLIKELKDRLEIKISASQVYPFLNILEKNKIIIVKERGERKKKIYKLTNKGKKFVKGIIHRFGDLLNIAIEPKLTTCAHCGCKVYKGSHKEIIGKKELSFCCKHCANSYKKFNKK